MLGANLVMAGAAAFGVAAWRLGRRKENEHDVALAALTAALAVASAIDFVLETLEDPAARKREVKDRAEARASALEGLDTALSEMRRAFVTARALWGREATWVLVRFDGYAHLFDLAVRRALGIRAGRWRYGEVPARWSQAAAGDRDACAAISDDVTVLLDAVEAWAMTHLRRRPWWHGAAEPEALATNEEIIRRIFAELPRLLESRDREGT